MQLGAELGQVALTLRAASDAVARRDLDGRARLGAARTAGESLVSEARGLLRRAAREGVASADLGARIDRVARLLEVAKTAAPAAPGGDVVARVNPRAVVLSGAGAARATVSAKLGAELAASGARVRVRLGMKTRAFTLTRAQSERAATHAPVRDARRVLGALRHARRSGAVSEFGPHGYALGECDAAAGGVAWAVWARVSPSLEVFALDYMGATHAGTVTGEGKAARVAFGAMPDAVRLMRAAWGESDPAGDWVLALRQLVAQSDARAATHAPAPARRVRYSLRDEQRARVACWVALHESRGGVSERARLEQSRRLSSDPLARSGEASTLNSSKGGQVVNTRGMVRSRKV